MKFMEGDITLLFVLLMILCLLIIYGIMLFSRHSSWFLGDCPRCEGKTWVDKIVRHNGTYSEGWHCRKCNYYSGRYTGTLYDYGGF